MRTAPDFAISRLLVAVVGAAALVMLWNAPALLAWGEGAAGTWLVIVQLAGPVIAASLSAWAALRSTGRERRAWAFIGAGSLLYIVGNLAYAVQAFTHPAAYFPTWADLPFLLMAASFAAGILLYGRRSTLPLAIDTYNFTLLYGAMIFGTLFLLHGDIRASLLDEWGTMVAFLYPALWGSVAALAAIHLVLYPKTSRSFAFLLLTLAMTAEGIADYIYATELMRRTFEIGTMPHFLWMVSAALIGWAAVEHVLSARRARAATVIEAAQDSQLLISEAVAPALILFVVLLTGTVSGAFGSGTYQYFAAGLTVVLAAAVGLREYWVATTRRQLQTVADERLRQLTESEERLTAVLESTSDSVLVIDTDLKVRFFNRQALQLVPELAEVGVGGSVWDLVSADERQAYGAQLETVMRTGRPWTVELFNPTRGVWVDLRAYPTGSGVSVFYRDITEERRSREEIAYLAHHDFLTGLGSRSIFSRKLAESLAAGRSRAVLLVDLDFFKDINDTLGHSVGDAVLVEVAHRVRSCAPEHALVARPGGDEFVLVVEDLSDTELLELGRKVIGVIALPISQAGQSLLVGASVGIASTRNASIGEDLFTKADIALYEAKSDGRGQVRMFEAGMEARVRARKALLSDLSRALEQGELELAYQPLLNTASRRTAGFEALLRWNHPVRGTIAPAEFIPLAEEGGLIDAIGGWVVRAACEEALNWPPEMSVSVNVSTRQLADPRFVEKVVMALHDSGFDHRRLELEVTESALLRDVNLPVLQELAELGIRITLDDFGTGYSSLSYLQRFPFSKLKIDRSFIRNVPADRNSLAIAGTVVDLAQILGMKVTAEGVETSAQFDWVARHCDQAQGFFIARPMSAREIPAYLAQERAADRERAAGAGA